MKTLPRLSLEAAQLNLETSVERFIKSARWFPYQSRINELRRPLLQLKKAKKTK